MATSGATTAIGAQLDAKRHPAYAVLDLIDPGADVIVSGGPGEPVTVVDAIEAGAERLRDVRVHEMLTLHDRPSIHGEVEGLRHVSWFLSPVTREAFEQGQCDLVPNAFSEVPHLMRSTTKMSLVVASASPPDRHGYFSLGLSATYPAALIDDAPVFLEANRGMPRTFGENQVHVSEIAGWCEADYTPFEFPEPPQDERDATIAALVAERIPDGATLQAGIGAIPNEILKQLGDHRELGVHTELLTEAVADLVEAGVVTGTCKQTHRNKVIATAAGGTTRLHEFVADNPGVEFWPVSYTNDPRVIGRENDVRAINATLEVDFLGQCASESLGSHYWSSSGGQPDFARGSLFSEGGASFIVLHSATSDESTSRVVSRLQPGAAVTSTKNVVDFVVTEHGVAELRGSSIRERTRKLIEIAHPKFRDELERQGRELGYL